MHAFDIITFAFSAKLGRSAFSCTSFLTRFCRAAHLSKYYIIIRADNTIPHCVECGVCCVGVLVSVLKSLSSNSAAG